MKKSGRWWKKGGRGTYIKEGRARSTLRKGDKERQEAGERGLVKIKIIAEGVLALKQPRLKVMKLLKYVGREQEEGLEDCCEGDSDRFKGEREVSSGEGYKKWEHG